MRMRVGINGFGRMGRLSLRAAWEWPEFDIVHINELKGGPQAAAHLLEFDTVHGRWQRDIRAEAEAIRIDDKRVSFSTQVKILAWYDNEWGYVHRLMELTRKLATAEQ